VTPRLDRAVSAVETILRGHWPTPVARERARSVVASWHGLAELGEQPTERQAADTLRRARLDCYGAIDVSDAEAESLAARVLLALDGVA